MEHLGKAEQLLRTLAANGMPASPEFEQGLRQAEDDAAEGEVVAALTKFLEGLRPRHPLESEGWRYLDPPTKFSPEMWQYFLRQLGGPQNYVLLAHSSGTGPQGPWERGQLMVSPAGWKSLQRGAEQRRKEESQQCPDSEPTTGVTVAPT